MNATPPSKTCLYVAAGRALGAREPDEAVRNPDYLAERLMGPEERALVADQACVRALDQDYAEASKNLEAMGTAIMMLVRTRFIEERLADAIGHGATQVVVLGAGFDTRAYRLTDLLSKTRVFEVDQPSTQEYKIRRVHEAGIAVPSNLTYVAVDFRHDSLDERLHAAGYDSQQVTFFIWEGVTMYLTEAAIDATLGWVGKQAPGSTIVFDFIYRSVLQFLASSTTLAHLPEQAQQAIARIRRLEAGEPWLFGIPNGEEASFLEKFGLKLTTLLPVGGEEARDRYLMRSDGSFILAGLPRPPVGAAANPSYCLAEARVGLPDVN
jgi:methyltransferase (TIGR00027 family)